MNESNPSIECNCFCDKKEFGKDYWFRFRDSIYEVGKPSFSIVSNDEDEHPDPNVVRISEMLLCNIFDKWVLKCLCGNYECRTTKTFNKIGDKVDQNRCQSCVDLERLRTKDFWKKNGLYPWQINN